MRYISFNKDAEPDCLKAIRESGKSSYEDDLQGDCKEKVKKALRKQQNGFCAYCEQKFKSTVFIEHYKAQSKDQNKEKVLSFDNFLGVCSGKYYLNLKEKSKKYIPHCDTSRGNKPLSINPRNLEHIKTIYYDKTNSIKSTNPDFDNDLNEKLNLNFEQLRELRNNAFKNNFNNLIQIAQLKKLNKKTTYLKGYKTAKDGKFEFSGFLAYRYLELLNGVEDNSI